MIRSRKVFIVAPAAVALMTVGMAVAPAAFAAASDCPSHNVCLWTDGHFLGSMEAISGYTSYQQVNSTEHDKASSWANHNTNQRECIIDYVGGVETYLDVLTAGENVGVVPSGTNDRADAVGWC